MLLSSLLARESKQYRQCSGVAMIAAGKEGLVL